MRGFINWYFGDFEMKNFIVFISILSFIFLSIEIKGDQNLRVINPKPDPNAKDVFTELVLLKEIKDGFRKESPNYFARISSICVDDEGNLYVADGKHKTIFKFSKDGEFIKTIGRDGQGPGEFMDEFMEISFGNDKRIYVVDNVRLKIIVYGKDGEFVKELKSPFFMFSKRDKVAVNSKGELFLYSRSGLRVIDKFDSSMKFMESYLSLEYLKEFTYAEPRTEFITSVISARIVATSKVITPNDHLIVMFPYSQRIVEIDEKGNVINDFYFRHPRFLERLKEEIEKIKEEKPIYEEGGPVYSFHGGCCYYIFLDSNGNICLPTGHIYRYSRDGKFIDILFAKKIPLGRVCAWRDRFYSADNLINLRILKIREGKK